MAKRPTEPSWVRQTPRPARLLGLLRVLSRISWFVVSAALFWLTGVAAGIAGVSLENWYLLALAGLCEVYAVVGLLFAAREDQ